jgi:predicted small lipoprotein YifL
MKKSLSALLIVAMILLSIAGCKKKEEQPQPAKEQQGGIPQGPIVETPMSQPSVPPGQMPPGHGAPGAAIQKVEFQVVVPQEVKNSWAAVKFIVLDKVKNKQLELTVPIGGEMKIPDSNLSIKVGPFLPDFKMDANTITSSSNEPNNAAVGIIIYEDGKQIYPEPGKKWGWFWARKELQTMHIFQHQRYAITLKEGIRK